ncbi:hypothetical protein Asera_37710 [Actinocatenispora sera]|uniref:Uncharacterized protein n=1 Tax=Actinocatenispora sera TaxID=390989 RepID=A0A810L2N6_9ACTN|nr:hypothetical protein Asera_37710 [Actinocatenispora sera]
MAAEWDQVRELDAEIDRVDEQITAAGVRGSVCPRPEGRDRSGRVGPVAERSTKRRQDAPDLPRLPVANRTIPHPHIGTDAGSTGTRCS